MKSFPYLISIIFFSLTAFQNPVRQRFSVQIHYKSNITPGIKYFLNQDRIKIFTSSDYTWKISTLLYNKALTSRQSESLYKLLRILKLDTLKSSYMYDMSQGVVIHDELYTHFIIYGNKIKLTKTTTIATTTVATDSLISIIKSKLLPDKYYPFKLLK